MNVYQASRKDPELQLVDLYGSNSWDDVVRAVNDAQQRYLNKGRRWPRKMARFVADNIDMSVSLLRLIPDEKMTSILCGGLCMVLELSD